MRLPNPTKYIPNTLTLVNLFLGCLSIVASFEGDLLLAGYLILFAAVFDFLDGFAARLLKAYSSIGKDLDSLSDLVSFGVAPSVIVFHLLKDALALAPEQGFSNGNVILAIPFLIAVFSALRLAKFNVDTRQTTSFIGLPTPANAIFIAGLVFALSSSYSGWFEPLLASPTAIIAMVLVLSALLVLPMPMFSLKFKKGDSVKGLWKQILLVLLSIVAIFLMGFASVVVIILAYVLLSIIDNVFAAFRK